MNSNLTYFNNILPVQPASVIMWFLYLNFLFEWFRRSTSQHIMAYILGPVQLNLKSHFLHWTLWGLLKSLCGVLTFKLFLWRFFYVKCLSEQLLHVMEFQKNEEKQEKRIANMIWKSTKISGQLVLLLKPQKEKVGGGNWSLFGRNIQKLFHN